MEMDLEAMIEASFAVEDNLELDPQSSSLFEDSGVDGGSFSRHSNYHSSSANTLNQTTTSGSTNIKDIFYCENYFDLNDILAQSQRVSVKFQRDIPKLGFIDPASSSQEDLDIKKGTKLELPLWIVKELNADHVISVTVPKGYNQVYREILEADANCVNLHKLGPNFYRFGQHISSMNLAESEDIAKSLLDTFTQRFNRLVNFSLSGSNVSAASNSLSSVNNMAKSRLLEQSGQCNSDETQSDMIAFTANLDNWEKSILELGQHTVRQMKRWANREMMKVEPNQMVISLNKRKRLIEQQFRSNCESGSSLQPPGS